MKTRNREFMKTSLRNLFILPALIGGLGLIPAGQVTAQTFKTLHSFTNGSDGYGPVGGLVLSGNTLYGTTLGMGGTVFSVNIDGTGFTTLCGLYGGPSGTLILSGKTLYGTTTEGGDLNEGMVFRVNTDGTGFTNLYSFYSLLGDGDGTGAFPVGGLILSGSTLYGTASCSEVYDGGPFGAGTVFAVNTDGTGFNVLHSFNFYDGYAPHGPLILSGNSLYGSASGGGGAGTVFAVNTDGTGFTNLFSAGPGPQDGLILSGNILYGTEGGGGPSDNGTVYAINTNLTGFTILHSFADSTGYSINVTNSDGADPAPGLTLAGYTLYGSMVTGGTSGNGTVYAINTNGTGFTVLHIFSALSGSNYTNSDGASPSAGLTLWGNTLYGTTYEGGSSGYGTVFSLSGGSIIGPVVVATTSLPSGTNGVGYNQTLAAFGGRTPYSWINSSGVLPPGLTLATNGVISGTPTANGTFNFTVEVTDAASNTGTQALALTVIGLPSVTMQPTNSSIAVLVGSNVTFAVSVTGTGPFSYQWQLDGTNLPNGIIMTVAGNGIGNYCCDGGVATNAELNYPFGVAVDATGNLFIADTSNNRIRKVGINGIISTVAGGGGYQPGDGGAATNAELNYPFGVAVDATGNLFIADEGNNRIRKVGTNGIITTVAGNGTNGYTGDGGAATSAELAGPSGVVVDATGNLFIADGFSRVRKVGTNGIITTVAGNGTNGYSGDGGAATNAELFWPSGVAVDATGNLFIADTYNQRIRKVGTNGIITTVAGNGTNGYSGDGSVATNAELYYPVGVAVYATGNLFIADFWNNRIREVGTNGIITTVAGNGTFGYTGDGSVATNAELYYPRGVAVDATGNLLIADEGNNRIRKVVNPAISVTGPTLVLNDVGFGNAGTYSVVVSSPYGSTTSSNIILNVTLPPVVLSAPQVAIGKTNFTFVLSGPAGSNYVLQVSSNLLSWSSVSTSTMPVSGSMTLTNAMSGYNRRFYRAFMQ
jgi:uncharacterized repeat protein (TIGR03803 family)